MTTCKKGDRIRLLAMPADQDPIPVGTRGTVTFVNNGIFPQIGVAWDNGRTLMLVPCDSFEVIQPAAEAAESDSPTLVTVTQAVLDGLTAARDSGMVNMLDLPAVAGFARQRGFHAAADWLNDRSNRATYSQGIFRGFQAAE